MAADIIIELAALTRDRARRPKTCKLVANRALARLVAKKLQREWSPEQIAPLSKFY